MQKGPLLDLQLGRHEVVLHRGVDLHDVSAAATNIVVHNSSRHGHVCWPLHDHERVRAIFERPTKLVRVHLNLQQAAQICPRLPKAKPICNRILRQRQRYRWSALESRAAAVAWVRVVELAVHEELVSFDASQFGAFLLRVRQRSQAQNLRC